jgi:hypothetical protein
MTSETGRPWCHSRLAKEARRPRPPDAVCSSRLTRRRWPRAAGTSPLDRTQLGAAPSPCSRSAFLIDKSSLILIMSATSIFKITR